MLAFAHQRQQPRDLAEQNMHLPGDDAGDRVRRALVGDVDEVGSGPQLEQLRDQMGEIAVAHGAEIELAGIGLGVGDQLLHVLRRKIRRHHQDLVALGDLGDRREVLDGVVVAEAVDGGPDHERAGIAEQQRVAVGLGGGRPPCCRARRRRRRGSR